MNILARKWKTVFFLGCTIVAVAGLGRFGRHYMVQEQKGVTLAISNPWGELTPAKQSTYAGAIVLANVFQSLVEFDPQGNLSPCLAKSWTVSEDLKTYSFKIDTTRRFSDGTPVTAQAIKESFEHSLKVVPSSAVHSALDLLYMLKGFENYQKTAHLEGIEAPTSAHLVMTFKNPFRQALSFLAGVRYSAYHVTKDGKYLGTGPYYIVESNDKTIKLKVNPYFQARLAFSEATIFNVGFDKWNQSLCNQEYDIYWLVAPTKFPECLKDDDIDFTEISGAYTSHITLPLNGMNGRFFSDNKLRRALQYLLLTRLFPEWRGSLESDRITLDPQFLLPLQPGRLDDNEVNSIIEVGAQWVPELIAKSQKQPIAFWTYGGVDAKIAQVMKNAGLNVATNPERLPIEGLFPRYYKTYDYDILGWSVGMGRFDPDGIYHYLGKNGAISSPPIGRPLVWKYLEEGRSIIDNDSLDESYKKVSRAIFEEVPAIHLAFYRSGFLYFKGRVKAQYNSVNGYRLNLGHFQPSH